MRNPTPDIPSEPAWPKWMAGSDDANDGEGSNPRTARGEGKDEGEGNEARKSRGGTQGRGPTDHGLGPRDDEYRLDDLREQADIAEGI